MVEIYGREIRKECINLQEILQDKSQGTGQTLLKIVETYNNH